MVVGNDLGGLLGLDDGRDASRRSSAAWSWSARRTRCGCARRCGATAAQRHASRYACGTFQVPRRPEHQLACDSTWVRELFDAWTGPRWRGTPQYTADVERYAEAMRIHPAYYCAAEYFRWLVRSIPRQDGRRFADSLRRPVRAPVLQLHGDFDTCVLPGDRAGLGPVRHRQLRVAGARRRRALPAQRGARARQR